MNKTPKFQPYRNHLGLLAGLKVLDLESEEPVSHIPMNVTNIDEMQETIDGMMFLTNNFPICPNWFTLEDEKPVQPYDPFLDKEAFFKDLGNEAKKAMLWILSVYSSDYDILLTKHLDLTENQQEWVNFYENKREYFNKANIQFEKDKDLFYIRREIVWKYYYVTMVLDIRNQMFGF